ncbi:ankyrin repeat and SOCS box protein 2 isoform X2 [Silurus meridionalis]|nr:ankyrin repeat and SOCS box protein 2 isoform X2 [Silurus meridionalis]
MSTGPWCRRQRRGGSHGTLLQQTCSPEWQVEFDQVETQSLSVNRNRRICRSFSLGKTPTNSASKVRTEDQLLSAVCGGDVRKVRNILDGEKSPRDLLRADADGWTVIHEASYYGKAECLKLLLTAVPDMINSQTRKHQTPLILAVSREHFLCVEYLLEKGADPKIPTVTNETPLYEACATSNVRMVHLLLRHGADVNQRCFDGWTALHESVSQDALEISCATSNVRMVHLLLKHGADVNQRCFDGWTALHESVSQDALEICELLVEHGAKIFSRNIYGVTPLFLAAQCGHLEVLHFLIHRGQFFTLKTSNT